MMANMIENAGPNLTPQNMQAQAPKLGAVGGGATGLPLLSFLPNDYQWIQDTRVVYWDKHRASSYNGKPGTYVQIEGNRFNLGQYPTMPDGPVLPGASHTTVPSHAPRAAPPGATGRPGGQAAGRSATPAVVPFRIGRYAAAASSSTSS